MKVFFQKSIKILMALALLIVPFGTNAGINDAFKGWAWSSNIGWISMNSTNQGTAPSYGVTVDDSGNLSGWSWSSGLGLGWICFGATCPGSPPGGGSSWALIDPTEPNTPQLFGWARIYSLYLLNPSAADGWISLNCQSYTGHPARNVCTDPTNPANYKVYTTTNGSPTDGQFQGYAWNCSVSSGSLCTADKYSNGIGWIHFAPIYTPPVNDKNPTGTYSGVPWVQVLYGDLYSKGSISTPTPFTGTFKQVNATYCIDSGLGAGGITHFTNDPTKCSSGTLTVNINLPKKSTNYSNVLGRIKLRGYTSSLDPINNNTTQLAAGKYGPWVHATDFNSIPTVLGGAVYDTTPTTGNWRIGPATPVDYPDSPAVTTFDNANANGNGSGLLIVRGNLTINNDIVYGNNPIVNLKQLASLGILVLDDGSGTAGNVTIDPSVTKISANIYAEGVVSTGTYNDPLKDSPLVINGVVAAKQFNFLRQYSSGVGKPAEQIFNDGRIVVNTPPGMNDFIASLPTVSY
jgi:hypothetical protein